LELLLLLLLLLLQLLWDTQLKSDVEADLDRPMLLLQFWLPLKFV
jgi:hypothetical protein